ncbi:MAG: DNA gyrase subunit A [Synergistaceae bacterium]|jgi:DNA gyrase subunit A|nr:DNA gyrase subunit A [Synergistaceae bacterium]
MDNDPRQRSLFDKVIPLPIEEEIKHSYLDYAMSVIVGRAIPDARDGLKPVQRRILYAMLELGLRRSHAFKKSATVVGETMGKYHPHGDAAIYGTMARLVQDFSMRYPLIDGQGNFGSIDGDEPAAMRYTEARLDSIGEDMLADIDEETVDWMPNFDESLQEPTLLPSMVPNLLVNGSSGIAVGMASNIPPHNIGEAIDACLAMLEKPDIELPELMRIIPGPDFPTGGVILGRDGIADAYATGRGKITCRGKTEVEELKRGKNAVVITEIPYMVNKLNLVETIAKCAQNGLIDGITEMRDESDRTGMRVVMELHRDADPNLVIRQLYNRTQLQTTFGVINLALVNGRPLELGLKRLLEIFLGHRRSVVRRRTEYRLRKAEERAHIVEGLVKALDFIDEVIRIIRAAPDVSTARAGLMAELAFSEIQAAAILEMRLQRLTGLERRKLEEELAALLADIERYRTILGNPSVLDAVIGDELRQVRKNYADKRRTEIQDSADDFSVEDLIPEAEIVVVLSRDGYIRRMPLQDYRVQSRGGKGVKGATPKPEDEISLIKTTTTHNTLCLFTSRGRILGVKCYVLPEPKTGKGKLIGSMVSLDQGEKVVAFRDMNHGDAKFVFFLTKQGQAKRMPIEELDGVPKGGRRVLGVRDDDEIARVRITNGGDELLFTTAGGQTLRVDENEFRPQGRSAQGVHGIKLSGDDRVVGCDVIIPGRQVLFVSERGIGKRTPYEEFTQHHRATGGVRAMHLTAKTGKLIGAWGVSEDDELMIISGHGRVVRMMASEISSLSRSATGYTIVRLDEGDTVADVSIIKSEPETSKDA